MWPGIVFEQKCFHYCSFFFLWLLFLWFIFTEKLGILTVPAMYIAEGNKVWQLQGTNDWITLSHCQRIILTLNKGEEI